MAPGAKSKTLNSRKSNIKRPKWSRAVPSDIFSNLPSTSRNRFSALADLTDMETDPVSNIVDSKLVRPPPLVVDQKTSLKAVQELLGSDSKYKRTSIGTKVFPQNKECFDKCKQILLEKKIEFHTFNSKENRPYTVFLHGLPRIATDDIKKDIEAYNLTPLSITEINTRFSSIDNAVYKVQFARKNFNPKSLGIVTAICNVIVSWKKYKPRRNGNPTQCWNCLMFGHGGEHCNRLSACMMCANQHHTNDCPLRNQDKTPAAFSCFNCKKHGKERTDHSANDVNCPLRSLYLETRSKATSQNTRRHNNNQQTSPRFSNTDIPIPNHNNNYTSRNMTSYADCVRDNNNLFSIDDLFNIFTTALADLQQCTTKTQQIQVVMSMVKYAYDLR